MYRIFHSLKDEASEGGEGGSGRDFAAEASAMGWVPKDKWNKDPAKWTDAQTFVERGERVLPIVLKENRDLKKEVEVLRQTQQQMATDVKDFRAMLEKTSAREKADLTAKYEQAVKDRAAAVTEGDGPAWEAANAEAQRLETEAAATAAAEAARKAKEVAATTENKPHPDYAAWLKDNPWFEADQDLNDEANEVAKTLMKKAARENKAVPLGAPLFKAVEAIMKKRYPELDKSEGDSSMSTVEGDGGPSGDTQRGNKGTKGKAKNYDALPADAKKACERAIATGMITDRDGKTLAEKRQAYCDIYDWEG